MKPDSLLFTLPFTTVLLAIVLFARGSSLTGGDLCVMAVMSLTSLLLYPFIWFKPSTWVRFVAAGRPRRAVTCFKYAVAAHKMALITSLIATGWLNVESLLKTIRDGPSVDTMTASLLFVAGLWLQTLVYRKIGACGVYYGFKMGVDVPWCTEFPFNALRHPQYVSASTLFGGLLLAMGWRESSIVLLCFQLWLYSVTAKMEEIGDQEPATGKGGKKKGR